MPSLSEAGKPFIFLLQEPELEKTHFRNYSKQPEAIAEHDAMIDALFRIVTSRSLTPTDLGVLKGAMKSPHKVVWDRAGRRLMQLSHYFPDASQALFELLEDKSARIRVRVIQSIWEDRLPEADLKRMIDRGLNDSSSVVRKFAQDRAESYLK